MSPNQSLSGLIDKGYELKKELRRIESESDEIKKVLRQEALNNKDFEPGSGETVVLHGIQHKAKVNLAQDSFSVEKSVSPTELRRMKAIIDNSALELQENIKIKDGISMNKVKERLGELFDELFEEDLQVKIDAISMTEWLKERRRKAGGSDQMVQFVIDILERKPNTPRVTFSKCVQVNFVLTIKALQMPVKDRVLSLMNLKFHKRKIIMDQEQSL